MTATIHGIFFFVDVTLILQSTTDYLEDAGNLYTYINKETDRLNKTWKVM